MQKPKYHHRGKFLSLLELDNWEYAERENCQGVVAIIATTAEEDIVLVEQFRIPVNASVIELPAGLRGDSRKLRGESLFDAARRELYEETGFEANNWSEVLSGPLSAGMSSETIDFVRATGLSRSGEGGGDSNEDIRAHIVPLNTVDQWLNEQSKLGKLIDPKIYAALYWIKSAKYES